MKTLKLVKLFGIVLILLSSIMIIIGLYQLAIGDYISAIFNIVIHALLLLFNNYNIKELNKLIEDEREDYTTE